MIRICLLAATTALAGCAMPPVAIAPVAPAAPVAIADPVAPAAEARPELGSFGFDVEGMDRSVAPGDDWVEFASGTYLRTLQIPADRSSFGIFVRLDDLSRERTRAIIEAAARENAAAGTNARKVGDYYIAFMDEAAIEARGAAPLVEDLAPFRDARTKSDFARALGNSRDGFGPSLFPVRIGQDAKAPDTYIAILSQAGLGMPDRDYYLSGDPKLVDTRVKYLTHVANMLRLTGVPSAQVAARARDIVALEKRFATVHWTRVESRQREKTYNKWSAADLGRRAPGFDWNAYLDAAGLGSQTHFIVSQPTAFTGMAKAIASTPLRTLKDWAALHTAREAAAVLPKAFTEERFDFSGRVLSGTPELEPRWKRGVNGVNAMIGEAVGELYVAKHFPPETKAQADRLVQNIIRAMDTRLANRRG